MVMTLSLVVESWHLHRFQSQEPADGFREWWEKTILATPRRGAAQLKATECKRYLVCVCPGQNSESSRTYRRFSSRERILRGTCRVLKEQRADVSHRL